MNKNQHPSRPLPLFVLLILALLGVLGAPGADAQEDADAIIAQSFAARGGVAAWRAVTTARLMGTLTMGGREGQFRVELKMPDKVRVELELGEVVHIQVRDGDTGWSQQIGAAPVPPQPLGEAELGSLRQQSDLAGPLLDWRQKGHQVVLEGKRKVAGREVYAFRVKLAEGGTQRIDLDAESLQEVRIQGAWQGGDEATEYLQLPGDYRVVGGVSLPHTLTQHLGNLTQTLTFTAIELNVPIADARFRMPRN
jgi:outer membrane lipoprotein-sorting protein